MFYIHEDNKFIVEIIFWIIEHQTEIYIWNISEELLMKCTADSQKGLIPKKKTLCTTGKYYRNIKKVKVSHNRPRWRKGFRVG